MTKYLKTTYDFETGIKSVVLNAVSGELTNEQANRIAAILGIDPDLTASVTLNPGKFSAVLAEVETND